MIIENKILNQSLEILGHSSGLTIQLMPMAGYGSTYVIFGTKYGSVDRSFKLAGEEEYLTVPDGVAHFLEHKLFENEKEDAFERYARTGASANAYTSFEKTCYLFSCTDKLKESLEILLDFVTSPYFTEETVKKEQGIIGQEIKMYQDHADWRVFFGMLSSLYHDHPVRLDIAGTAESISKIDSDMLYRCYRTFYSLSNMVLCIAGKFEREEVLAMCDRILKKAEDKVIHRAPEPEPPEIVKSESVVKLPVSMPIFNIGYKEKPFPAQRMAKGEILSEILLEMLAGSCSPLYKKLYEAGLINQSFGTEALVGKDFRVHIFGGESKDPKAVLSLLKEEIALRKKDGLDPTLFEDIRKMIYGKYIKLFGSTESVASAMSGTYFKGYTIFEPINLAAHITFEELTEQFLSDFQEDRVTLSIVEPI